MSAAIITDAELTAYGSRSLPMSDFTGGQITEANDRATDRIRQAALNDYTAESFELLTPSNAPDDLRAIALESALAILTDADAGRPQTITDGAIDAAKRLGFLAGGRTYYDKSPGSVLVKVSDGVGSVVSQVSRKRVFDRDSDTGKYESHDPEIA